MLIDPHTGKPINSPEETTGDIHDGLLFMEERLNAMAMDIYRLNLAMRWAFQILEENNIDIRTVDFDKWAQEQWEATRQELLEAQQKLQQ